MAASIQSFSLVEMKMEDGRWRKKQTARSDFPADKTDTSLSVLFERDNESSQLRAKI